MCEIISLVFFLLRRVRSESSGSPDPTWRVNPHSPLQRFRLNYRSSCSQKAPPSTPGPPDTPSLPCKCDTFQTFSHNTSTLEGTNIEAEEGRRRGGMKECTNSSGGGRPRENGMTNAKCCVSSPPHPCSETKRWKELRRLWSRLVCVSALEDFFCSHCKLVTQRGRVTGSKTKSDDNQRVSVGEIRFTFDLPCTQIPFEWVNWQKTQRKKKVE